MYIMLLNIHKCIAQSGWLTILHLGRQGKLHVAYICKIEWNAINLKTGNKLTSCSGNCLMLLFRKLKRQKSQTKHCRVKESAEKGYIKLI